MLDMGWQESQQFLRVTDTRTVCIYLVAFFCGAHKKDEDQTRDQRKPPNLWTGIEPRRFPDLSHI